MPSSYGIGDQKIIEAVKIGKLDEKELDQTVERLLKIIFKAIDNRKRGTTYDKQAHHKLARKIAGESMVLLKNQDNILPLKKRRNHSDNRSICEKAKIPRRRKLTRQPNKTR